VILRTFEDIKADIEIKIIEIKKDHFLIYQIGICPSYKQTNYPQTQTHRGIPPATVSLPLSCGQQLWQYLLPLTIKWAQKILDTMYFVVNERDGCGFRFEFLQVCLSRGDPPFVNLTDPDDWRVHPPHFHPFSSTLCLAHRSLLWAMRVWFLIFEYVVATCVFLSFWVLILFLDLPPMLLN